MPDCWHIGAKSCQQSNKQQFQNDSLLCMLSFQSVFSNSNLSPNSLNLFVAHILLLQQMINQALISGACCCLQCCCKELSETAYKIVGRVAFVKLMYSLIYFSFIGTVFLGMWFLREWEFFMSFFADGINCQAITSDFDCISASVIYRIMLSLFLFGLIMLALLSTCSQRVGQILNEGLFFTKFVVCLLIFLGTLQLGDSILVTFSQFAQVFSYLFILWQIIIVIDLSYLWGIRWAQRYSQGSQVHACLLISFTIINYVLAVGLNVWGYILSSAEEGQACSMYPNILSSVILVGLFGVQLLNYNKQNSLLATSALSLFNAYWLLSSIFAQQQCNRQLILDDGSTVVNKNLFLKINIPVSCFLVLLSSFGSIYGSSNQQSQSQQHFIQLKQKADLQKELKSEEEESLTQERQMWIKWHLFMLAMSLYISMVLTDWGSGDILRGKFQLTVHAHISKVFTAVVCTAVYGWTLLAPRFFPGRNFYFQ